MRPALAAALGALSGVVVAVLVEGITGVQAFWPGLSRALGAVVLAGGAGALVGWCSARMARGPGAARAGAMLGGIVAVTTSGLVLHAPLPWLSLSVFGAGPAGALSLVVLPLALGAAGWVAGAGVDVTDRARRPRG